MSPVYDFCCRAGHITEHYTPLRTKHIKCQCGLRAKRIISASGHFVADENAPWIKSVLDVVDKDSKKAHVQEFIKNPNRENYHKWMRGEGLRPVDQTEHGGPPSYKKEGGPDLDKVTRQIMAERAKRNRIVI